MTLTDSERIELSEKFLNGETLEEFVALINMVIELQNEKLNVSYKAISINKFKYYLSNRDSKYVEFSIAKKSGGERVISVPDRFLMKVQRRIAFLLQLIFTPKKAANGFVRGRSIVSNAEQHVGKRFVFNTDLKDFFPTIHYGRIRAVLKLTPFRLSEEFSHLIAHLSCYNGVLPQGGATSPVITNLVCQALDYRLIQLARHFRCYYSRYADDLSFSSNKNTFEKATFINSLREIVEGQGFQLNHAKTRLQKYSQKQEVTGITVNEKLNVPRKFIRNVNAMLHNWENQGFGPCQDKLNELSPGPNSPDFDKVLLGKINYIGMVRGKDDLIFQRFKLKYDQLKQNTQ